MAEAKPKKKDSYQKELPANRAGVWRILERYSKIPPDKIDTHLITVRDKAWKVFPYGCIGRWVFLDNVIKTFPEYPAIVERIKSGDVLIDAGCAFGYVLRQLVVDGAPAANLIGTDIQQGFIDLGYELFRDGDTFDARFFVGDLLNFGDPSVNEINGKVDMIYSGSFFHLFGWDDQVKIGIRFVQFFKPDAKEAMIIGRQIANPEALDPATHAEQGPSHYHHSMESWQQMWEVIGEKTSTSWKVTGHLQDIPMSLVGPDGPKVAMNFVIYKVA